MTELIGAMCLAYDSTYSLKGHVPAMTEAARVIADALLSNPSGDECELFDSTHQGMTSCDDALCEFIANRRAHIEPKPKTPEERVTVEYNTVLKAYDMRVDRKLCFSGIEDRQLADLARLGAVEQLKQKEAK